MLPGRTLRAVHQLKHFIVEREKTARAFLKAIDHPLPQSEFVIHELDKHRDYGNFKEFLQTHASSDDLGLLSEAGLPAVADPGAQIVAYAHQLNLKVVPYAGSSSIFLALMASGMNGQDFRFHGYLPIDQAQRIKKLKEMEKRSATTTQLFMEAPYRNNDFLKFLLKHLSPQTKLCVAADLESSDEWIQSKRVKDWKSSLPDLHKRPCIYLIAQ